MPSHDHTTSHRLGVITVVLTLLAWSSTPLFIQHFAHSLDVWSSNGWRYAFAAIIWAPVLIIGRVRRTLPKGLAWRALTPSIFNAAGQTAFALSFYHIDAATGSFGLRSQIIFVAIGAYFLFPSERALLRDARSWLGIVLVLVGLAATLFLSRAGGPAQAVGVHASHGLGIALAVGGGILFAGYSLEVRRRLNDVSPLVSFAAISQYTALFLVLGMLAFGQNAAGEHNFGAGPLDMSAGQFSLFVLSSVIGIALGHVWYYTAIARLGVAVSSGVVQLQPFVVAVAQMAVFGRALAPAQWAGGGMAITGACLLLWVQWGLSSRGKPADPPDPHGVLQEQE
ncbi:MAG: EamA family transporter [Tepidisphaera sp.]|nr:EamA family transporter [Tepidisphaera sp.]